jgi:DHA1 family bicyclomycin/chloramphenicol resistance-like MFS transporter
MQFWRIRPPALTPGLATQWIIAALVSLGPFSLTMYQPALPLIGSSLRASTGQIQLTLTVYLTAFAVGQLIYGPLSDHFGRRRVLLSGIAIFVLGAIACVFARSVHILIAARIVQGFGACAGPALGRAMIRDLYGPKNSAKALAFVSSALSVAPAIAPVFGGYIATWLGWQAIFGSLAIVGTCMLLFVLLRVPETNPYVSEGTLRLWPLVTGYGELLRSRHYLGYMTIAATSTAGSLAFQTAAPFLLIDRLGISPSAFGWLLIVLTGAYFGGTLLANRLAARGTVNRTLVLGSALLLVGSGLQFGFALSGLMTVLTVMLPQVIWLVAMGVILPSAMAGAVAPFPKAAGSAAALQGFAMMAAGALSSLVLSQLGSGILSLGAVMLVLALAGSTIFATTVVAVRTRKGL